MPPTPHRDASLEEDVRAAIAASVRAKQALLADKAAIALICDIAAEMAGALRRGRRIFLFGNGGSAADAQHIAAELVGRFRFERPALPVMALTVNTSCLTAIANDSSYDAAFARQLEAFASPGDIAIGISTSGNSPNVLRAIDCANQREVLSVGLTGQPGGALRLNAQRCICAPSSDTPRIQEMHILIGHILSEIIERELFSASSVESVLSASVDRSS